MGDVLYIVVPCYNEEAVLPETQKELGNKLETIPWMRIYRMTSM